MMFLRGSAFGFCLLLASGCGDDGTVEVTDAGLMVDGSIVDGSIVDGPAGDTGLDGGVDALDGSSQTQAGRLVAFEVEGLAFETATQSGTTDAEGGFAYLAGESVRFSVGDVVLGDVPAKETLTLFDLAGAEVLTGNLAIERALRPTSFTPEARNVPFQRLINLATFLQSIDSDGDGANGVEILPELTELLVGASVDFDAPIGEIRYGALNRAVASGQAAFSVPHPIARPSRALEALYGVMGVDPNIFGLTRIEVGLEGDVPRVRRDTFDARGQYVERTADATRGYTFDGFGYLETVTPETAYGYDAAGNLTSAMFGVGSHDYTYLRNVDGRTTREEASRPGDMVVWTRVYDDEGQLTSETVVDRAGTRVVEHRYDAAGNRVRSERSGDGAAGITIREYDGEGRVVLESFDADSDGDPETQTTTEYDVDGNTARVRVVGAGGMVTEDTRYEYEDGLLTTTTRLTTVTVLVYDADGHIVEEVQSSIDGTVTSRTRFTIDEESNRVRAELDNGDDGSIDHRRRMTYEPTGWAAVFLPTED